MKLDANAISLKLALIYILGASLCAFIVSIHFKGADLIGALSYAGQIGLFNAFVLSVMFVALKIKYR